MKIHTKILGSLSALVVLLSTPTADAANIERPGQEVSKEKFVARVGDMARAAKAAYENGNASSVDLSWTGTNQNGRTSHSHVPNWSSDNNNDEFKVVQAFKHSAGDNSISIILSFRGTQAQLTTPVTSVGDLLRDLQGAVIRQGTNNPWISPQENVGNVGQGFHARVYNYMNGAPGRALRENLDRYKAEGKEVEIHVTGHSLGAIGAQIFSFYLAQYMRLNDFPGEKFKINNFGFNTPRGVGQEFANSFTREINEEPFLTAYTMTITGDPVSDWTLSWLRGALIAAPPQGYCAHAQFETVDPSRNPIKKLNNHWLDADAIFKFGSIGQYEAIDSNLPQCMADGYFSFI